jgi:hypothetical protein
MALQPAAPDERRHHGKLLSLIGPAVVNKITQRRVSLFCITDFKASLALQVETHESRMASAQRAENIQSTDINSRSSRGLVKIAATPPSP